jgi:hypothetical protein
VRPNSIDRRHTESELSHPGTYPLRALTPVVPFTSRDLGTAKTKAAGGRGNPPPRRSVPLPEQGEYRPPSPPCKKFWTPG